MASHPPDVTVCPATARDASLLASLVEELADFEQLPRPDAAARARLARDVTGERRRADAFLAFVGAEPAGYAIVFETYTSFAAMPALFLEDIFVREAFRGRRVGYALFRAMASEAARRGCCRMEWQVLHWNAHAIAFYERLGARRREGWHTYQLDREAFATLL